MKAFYILGWAWLLCTPMGHLAGAAEAAPYAVVQEVEKPEIVITATENRIRVENAPVGSRLEIYSVVGIKVKEIAIKQPTAEYVVDIAKGYYIIRIGETVRKVAIR